ncbi:MAG: hypothetical protein AAFU85_15345 [Planctomycetota bacterium]
MSSPEDLFALGAVFLVVFAVVAVLALFMMAWTLQIAAGMIGTKPSYLGCVGTLLGIASINGAIVFIGQVSLGAENAWMVVPVTWFITVFMVAKLADCGLIKGFFIWIVNSFFATFGMIALMTVALIPIAMIGGGLESTFEELAAKVEADDSGDDFGLEAQEVPGFQQVGYETSNPFGSDGREDDSSSNPSDAFFQSDDSAEYGQPTEQESVDSGSTRSDEGVNSPAPVKPRRAKDGSTLNPFFNQ